MTHRTPKDMDDVRQAVAAGTLEMQRPWGDWVRCRHRAGKASGAARYNGSIPVFMEAQVEATITKHVAKLGFPGVRIAA